MSEDSVGRSKAVELFEKNKQFTEELLRENENLRKVIAKLKSEMSELKNHYIKADVAHMKNKIEVLEKENNILREENQELRDQFTFVEDENREFAERYIEVEQQNSDLISLYVASYQLHSTLNYKEVLAAVQEIVINLVGAEEFGIFVFEPGNNQLHLVAHEGLEGVEPGPIPLGTGKIGESAQSGQVLVSPRENNQLKDMERPVACIPMKVDEETVGVVVIYSLLTQKATFGDLDFELFEMLGQHAATAIYSARMFSLSERKRSTLEGFLNLIKEGAAQPMAESSD